MSTSFTEALAEVMALAERCAQTGDAEIGKDFEQRFGVEPQEFLTLSEGRKSVLINQHLYGYQGDLDVEEGLDALDALFEQTDTVREDWECLDGPETGVGVEQWYIHKDGTQAYTCVDQGSVTVEVTQASESDSEMRQEQSNSINWSQALDGRSLKLDVDAPRGMGLALQGDVPVQAAQEMVLAKLNAAEQETVHAYPPANLSVGVSAADVKSLAERCVEAADAYLSDSFELKFGASAQSLASMDEAGITQHLQQWAEFQARARYAYGAWTHLFTDDSRQETTCRVVIDVKSRCLVAAQEWTGLKYEDVLGDRLDDLQESIIEVNEVYNNFIDFGLVLSEDLPEWAMSSLQQQLADSPSPDAQERERTVQDSPTPGM